MIFKSRAPLRLGLAGGGTDVSPYCDTYGGCVLNATIDKYAYATIKLLNTSEIKFVATDLGISKKFSLDETPSRGILDLHVLVYNEMMKRYNDGKNIALELSTFCDAPIGSGLGSSSTLVVAMIQVFLELFNQSLDDYELADLAFKIERIDGELQGGRQDQYSATFGGFNFMEFFDSYRTVVNPLRIKDWVTCELESMLLLYFTGVSRESSTIIRDQRDNVTVGNADAIQAMHGIKEESVLMKEYLLRGNISGLIESMKKGWENKKKSARTVSNETMDKIYSSALDSGALAGKVSGAGGGGFMLFFAPPKKRITVIETLDKFGGMISSCHFTNKGVMSWKIK